MKTADTKSMSSQQWIKRQLSDKWSERARAEGWRSRAAFKLLEIDERRRVESRLREAKLEAEEAAEPEDEAVEVGLDDDEELELVP